MYVNVCLKIHRNHQQTTFCQSHDDKRLQMGKLRQQHDQRRDIRQNDSRGGGSLYKHGYVYITTKQGLNPPTRWQGVDHEHLGSTSRQDKPSRQAVKTSHRKVRALGLSMWAFPSMGVHPNHPFSWDFPRKNNHPTIGVPPWLWKPPCHLGTFQTKSALSTHPVQVTRTESLWARSLRAQERYGQPPGQFVPWSVGNLLRQSSTCPNSKNVKDSLPIRAST